MHHLIASIDTDVLWRHSDSGVMWYDPFPARTESGVIMLAQPIFGSDVYGDVHEFTSSDLGQDWVDGGPVDAFAERKFGSNRSESVVGPVPLYHPATGATIAIGTNVFAEHGVIVDATMDRHVVYAVRYPDGSWSPRHRLEWNDPRASGMYASSCLQSLALPHGDVLIPVQFLRRGDHEFASTTLLCSFDGTLLHVKSIGTELHLPVKRGIFEPSIVQFGGRFHLTLRAEDGNGYHSSSDDGLAWSKPEPWCWDDGSSLVTSTTQQHWLAHSDGLFLVYTRKTDDNPAVIRWRAPLLVSEVDTTRMCLISATEQVVLPLLGDGTVTPSRVPYFGNFAVTTVSATESWVTDCSLAPWDGYRGDTYLARIRWRTPNQLVEHQSSIGGTS